MINSIFLNSHTFKAVNRSQSCTMEKLNMSSNLERFSKYIAGDWTNFKQSNEFPALWSYIHVCYQPLPVNFLGTPSFYVESAYDYSLDKPYKTAIVSIKETTNRIEMKNYKIKQPERFWLGAHQPSLLNNLERVDIIQLPSICDTMFEYNVDKKTYLGKTRPGKKCVIMRGEIQTYLDSRLTISHNSYSSWDIGREVKSNEQI